MKKDKAIIAFIITAVEKSLKDSEEIRVADVFKVQTYGQETMSLPYPYVDLLYWPFRK